MKKKIKNLTLKQVKELCEKHFDSDEFGKNGCYKCPFSTYSLHCKLTYYLLDDYGDEVVEL